MPRRSPLSPDYGIERYLVALLNLGGIDVTAEALAAEMSKRPLGAVYEALKTAKGRSLVTVRRGRVLLYSLTKAGRDVALHASPDTAEWKTRYDAGESDESIAIEGSYPLHVVQRALTQAGVTLRPRLGKADRPVPIHARTKVQLTGSTADQILKLLQSEKRSMRAADIRPHLYTSMRNVTNALADLERRQLIVGATRAYYALTPAGVTAALELLTSGAQSKAQPQAPDSPSGA
jgi:DNA-binding PadR family transcriptional regulator